MDTTQLHALRDTIIINLAALRADTARRLQGDALDQALARLNVVPTQLLTQRLRAVNGLIADMMESA